MILDRLDLSKTDPIITTASSFDPPGSSKNDQKNLITLATAVRVIQAHERARQGRIHAYFMHRMKAEVKTTGTKLINKNNLDANCLIIQTIWRQKYAEQLFDRKKTENTRILDMVNEFSHLVIAPRFRLLFRSCLDEMFLLLGTSIVKIRRDRIYSCNTNRN